MVNSRALHLTSALSLYHINQWATSYELGIALVMKIGSTRSRVAHRECRADVFDISGSRTLVRLSIVFNVTVPEMYMLIQLTASTAVTSPQPQPTCYHNLMQCAKYSVKYSARRK